MKVIFATKNPGKVREIEKIMADFNLPVVTMTEAGFNPNIDESGSTFKENALIKVRAIGPQPDAIIMSDDSGLCIDAFEGAPGIHSARWLGEDTSYGLKNTVILSRLAGLQGKERAAHYTCAVALLFPDGREEVVEAEFHGEIAPEPAGENGFGYDPIFYLPEYGKTTGELGADVKNEISHRHLALEKAKEILRKELKSDEEEEKKPFDVKRFWDYNQTIDVRGLLYTVLMDDLSEEEENRIREAAYKRIDEIDAFMKENDLLG